MENDDVATDLPDISVHFRSPGAQSEAWSDARSVYSTRTASYQLPPPPSLDRFSFRPLINHYSSQVDLRPEPAKAESSLVRGTAPPEPTLSEPTSALSMIPRKASEERPSTTVNKKKNSSIIPYTILGNTHFRLVTILPPAEEMSTISCEMQQYRMDHCPAYIAISYAWGDRRDQATISLACGFLDSESVAVTSSLRNALMALRHPTEPVRVWADALSINQSDNDELSRQVRVMDRIYQNASQVAMWLGPSSNESTLAIKTLRRIGTETISFDAEKIKSVAKSTSSTAISAIVDLFERGYWKRLWIVQEVFYANKVVLYCGDDHVEWKEISEALVLFNRPEWKQAINGIYPPGKTLGRGLRRHHSFAQVLATQGPQSLLYQQGVSRLPTPITVMRHTRNKLAARPEDKVLGVISLLGQNIRSTILPDFNLVPRETFTELVTSIIKDTESLDIICEAIHYPYYRDVFDLPSWVADWSHAPDMSALTATNLEHREPFKASGDLKHYDMGEITNDKGEPAIARDELTIEIKPLGVINSRGMAVGTLGRLTNYLMAFLEWRQLLMEEFEEEGEPERQAFCRTLCLGEVPSSVDLGFGSRPLKDGEWAGIFYTLFSMFLAKRLGKLPLDPSLQERSKVEPQAKESKGRAILQQYFGDHMMGRCFCVLWNEGTKSSKAMGLGTGFMGIGDLVVVARGCSTPIILRSTSKEGRFEFIGDIYVDGYMDGEALNRPGNSWKSVVLS